MALAARRDSTRQTAWLRRTPPDVLNCRADTWPDQTRVSPRSPQRAVRWETLGTRLEFLNSKTESRRMRKYRQKSFNNGYISEFIVAARRKDGEDLEPSSLRGLISALIGTWKPADSLAVLFKRIKRVFESSDEDSPTQWQTKLY